MDFKSLFGSGVLAHDGIHFDQSDIKVGITESKRELTHSVIDGIAVMRLSVNYFMGDNPYSIESYSKYIYDLKSDTNIKGLIFEQCSGGGAAVAGALLRSTFIEFSKVKPVINLIHVAGSASYWAASGSNLIIASTNMSSIGSIGALISLDKFSRMIDIAFTTDVYAEQSKDKNEAWRQWILDESNVEKYQEQANAAAQIFIDDVKASRPLVKDSVFSGKMYNALEAKRLGLIDGIGSIDYCMERMKSQLGNYK